MSGLRRLGPQDKAPYSGLKVGSNSAKLEVAITCLRRLTKVDETMILKGIVRRLMAMAVEMGSYV